MTRSALISFLFVLFIFGFCVPYWKGLEFFDAFLLLVSCSVPLVFIAPSMAAAFSSEGIRDQVVRAVAYSWILALLILVNGIATINVRHWFGSVLMPPAGLLLGALAMNLGVGVFLATETALLSRRRNPKSAVQRVRLGFFAILIVAVSFLRFAPASWQTSVAEHLTTEGVTAILLGVGVFFAALSALIWKPATQ